MNIKTLFNSNESPTIEQYLERCGVDDPQEYLKGNWVENYINYQDIKVGVEMLRKSVCDDGKIILLCDSDCDGYCATTIAYQFLIYNCGVNQNDIIVLFHNGKQHGLSKDILEDLHCIIYDEEEISLLWIPDAGTNDWIECAYFAKCWNIPILITDHHEFNKDWLGYKDVVVINNQALGTNVINKDLCGAGVTHKLISAYSALYGGDIYKKLIDLVALATISDVCDLRSLENRTIVKWGLANINNPFLRAICKEFISNLETTPTTLAWNVVPKINAVCRSNDMDLKEELFNALSKNKYADNFIERIKKCHEKQRAETDKIYNDVLNTEPIGNKVKIFNAPNTPYTGLVATKLAKKFGCPCMVVHENAKTYTGSLRSPCKMRTQLDHSGLMTICAGHEQACGVGWLKNNTKKLSAYCEKLDLTPEPKDVMASYDTIFIPSKIFEIADVGKTLWGHGIPEPTIHVKNITINGQDIKELGANKTTIKFLYGDIEFIMFYASKDVKERMNVGKDIDMQLEIVGTPTINTFRDKETKQVVIEDWEIV